MVHHDNRGASSDVDVALSNVKAFAPGLHLIAGELASLQLSGSSFLFSKSLFWKLRSTFGVGLRFYRCDLVVRALVSAILVLCLNDALGFEILSNKIVLSLLNTTFSPLIQKDVLMIKTK